MQALWLLKLWPAFLSLVEENQKNYHIASLLADRFGLLSSTKEPIPVMIKEAKVYGVGDRILSIKALDIPVGEFQQRKDELEAIFVERGKELRKQGAQLIVPACLAILPALGSDSAERLSRKLGITVLNSNAIALRVAEMLANLKVTQSPLAFPATGEWNGN